MVVIIYNNKLFKPYDEMYYVSADGDIYSTYKRGLLKHNIDINGYHRVDIHRKHIKVHKLVYLVWRGEIINGLQINHIDDNKDNNHYSNLYLGSQKDNIKDCCKNKHRVGQIKHIKVYDKLLDKVLEFPTIKSFLEYTGHPQSNGSLQRCKNRNWFKKRFKIIEEKRCRDYRKLVELNNENKAFARSE